MKIGIISDIHEDINGLRKSFEIFQENNCTEFICLGDITGFSVDEFMSYFNHRDANACVDLVKNSCSAVVPGNHDLYNTQRIPKFISNFIYPENWYEMTYDERKKLADNRIWLYEHSDLSPMLNRRNQKYLQSLEEFQVYNSNTMNILCTHSAFPDLSGSTNHFIANSNELGSHFKFMQEHNCTIGLSGHHHPEAAIIATESSFELKSFGKYQLPSDLCWIVVPSIAESDRKLGVSILDLSEMTIEFIKL